MKNLLLSLGIVLVAQYSSAQVFNKTYTGLFGTSYGALDLANSDILIYGKTNDAPVGGDDLLLARADINGDTIWQMTYGSQYDDEAWTAYELVDGTIMAGFSTYDNVSGDRNIGIIKVDALGNLLWSKLYNTAPLALTTFGMKFIEIGGQSFFSYWVENEISFVSVDATGAIVDEYNYEFQTTYTAEIEDIGASLTEDVVVLVTEYGAVSTAQLIELDLVNGTMNSTSYTFNASNSGMHALTVLDSTYLVLGREVPLFGSASYYLSEINSVHTVKWCSYAFQPTGFSANPISCVFVNDSIYASDGFNNLYVFDNQGNRHGVLKPALHGIYPRFIDKSANDELRICGYLSPSGGSYPMLVQLDSAYSYGACTPISRNMQTQQAISASSSLGGVLMSTSPNLTPANYLMFSFPNYNHYSYVLDASLVSENVNCKSACDGSGEAIILGGSPPYNVVWSNSVVGTDNPNLCPGSYVCQIVDSRGCSLVDSIAITEPDTLTLIANSVNTYCGGDTVAMSSTTIGGTAPYAYQWTAPNQFGMVCDTCPNSDLYTEFDQTWTITVTDTNGCMASDDVYVQTSEPVITEICVVTVDTGSTHNMVIWEKPAAPNLDHFRIYRDVVGTWYHIGDVPYDSLSQFVDTTFGIDPNATSYQYAISSVDTCGNESDLSAHHQTMHLTQNMGLGGEANLIWDNYEGFGFIFYRIMRDTGNGVFAVLDSVTATNTTYTDWNAPNNQTRYRIQIVLDQQCVSSRANHNTTRSNRTQPPSNGGGGSTDIVEVLVGDVSVYPNPSKGNVSIDLSSQTNLDAMISLYGMDGRLIKQFNKTIFEGDNQIQLNLDMLERGMYQLLIAGEGLKVVERIVKE